MGDVMRVGGNDKKKKVVVDINDILKNKNSKIKLQNYIDESVIAKTKMMDLKLALKDQKEGAVQDLGIHPKLFSALVNLFFNNNFDEKQEEMSQLEAAILALLQTDSFSSKPSSEKLTLDIEEDDDE